MLRLKIRLRSDLSPRLESKEWWIERLLKSEVRLGKGCFSQCYCANERRRRRFVFYLDCQEWLLSRIWFRSERPWTRVKRRMGCGHETLFLHVLAPAFGEFERALKLNKRHIYFDPVHPVLNKISTTMQT
jgi:hypothetical protein